MILLDTHAWTRWLHPELGPNLTPWVRRWIEGSNEVLAVSVISCLEISQLVTKGMDNGADKDSFDIPLTPALSRKEREQMYLSHRVSRYADASYSAAALV